MSESDPLSSHVTQNAGDIPNCGIAIRAKISEVFVEISVLSQGFLSNFESFLSRRVTLKL